MEEREPGLEINKDLRIFDDRKINWKDMLEGSIEYKGKIHLFGW